MTRTFRDVVLLWPSQAALARDMGEKPSTVRKWALRNSIPADKWARLLIHAKGRGIDLTAEQLVWIANQSDAA